MKKQIENTLKKIKTGLPVAPLQVELHLTNRCNHNCKWCISRELRNNKPIEMSTKNAKQLLRQLAEAKCQTVLFSGGGEPLLHPDVEDIICFAASIGMTVSIITNGSFIEKLYSQEVITSLSLIRISVDAHDRLSYQRIHRPEANTPNYNELMEKIHNLERKTIPHNKIEVSYIIDENNIGGIEDFLCDCINIGVFLVDIKTEHSLPYTKRKTLISLAEDVLKKEQFQKLRCRLDTVKRRDGLIKKKWVRLCYSGNIEPNGELYPCCHTVSQEFLIGNVFEDNFKSIWEGEKHRGLIEQFYKKEISCSVCADASDTLMILKGCAFV